MYVDEFVIDGLDHLNSLKIGSNSFTANRNGYGNDSSRSSYIGNCNELNSIDIGAYSFSDYGGGLNLNNLPNLNSINVGQTGSGSYNFYGSSLGIESGAIIDI